MSIPINAALALIEKFRGAQFRNLIAQSESRQLLEEIGEDQQNFPAYDRRLVSKVTLAAYRLLGAACSLAEQQRRGDSVAPFFEAGSLLHAAMAGEEGKSPVGSFHELIAAMAFYAAGHYSRAFVALREVEARSISGRLIYLFLRKDIHQLISAVSEVLLESESVAEVERPDIEETVIAIAIARAFALLIDFFVVGPGEGVLERARSVLLEGQAFANESESPALWWLCRLLLVMIDDLYESSPWYVLPPQIGPAQDNALLKKYIQTLATMPRAVVELWRSQRTALIGVLGKSNKAFVVNLRTSAGKTRVAEAAIVQALVAKPDAVVLYLAPFRSLAYEIEEALSSTLGVTGLTVSHLYGGQRVSAVDLSIAGEAQVLIATPEKASALLRLQPALLERLALTIVDEGHLLGDNDRYIRNEVFLEYLRARGAATNRILLLSAVLPNPDLLATWLSGDPAKCVSSDWRPAGTKKGLLLWDGKRVRLEWRTETQTFNPSFVVQRDIGSAKKPRHFPKTKFEAVAATAVRLCKAGPVLIFAGRAVSVPTITGAVVSALGKDALPHEWPTLEWEIFKATCEEELGPDAPELVGARLGVISHSNDLTPQVRAATERLMRSFSPKVIVATTTLGQGVNLGVSAVIVASPYPGPTPMSKRDFWNICGRAGRAYVDVEGRILFAVDLSLPSGDREKIKKRKWTIHKDLELADGYLEGFATEHVHSGLLKRLSRLKAVALASGVDFAHLVSLAAENTWEELGATANEWIQLCDLLDDQLLSFCGLLKEDATTVAALADIVEESFRSSLAAVEARSLNGRDGTLSEAELIDFVRTRAKLAFSKTADTATRKRILRGGLPLRIASELQEHRADLEALAGALLTAEAEGDASDFNEAIETFETWIERRNLLLPQRLPAKQERDAIRDGWLRGVPLAELSKSSARAVDVAREFYGYLFPWILSAVANHFLELEDEVSADVVARAALRVELGLPTHLATLVFMAGVRSRAIAVELAGYLEEHATVPVESIGRARRALRLLHRDFKDSYQFSEIAKQWLSLLERDAGSSPLRVHEKYEVKIDDIPPGLGRMNVRTIGDAVYLVSPDYSYNVRLDSFPDSLRELSNDNRYCIARTGGAQKWKVVRRPPTWLDELFEA